MALKRVVAILWMKVKVINSMTIMYGIKEISILFIQSMLADCSRNPDDMQAECLLHIHFSFSTIIHLNELSYDLSFIIAIPECLYLMYLLTFNLMLHMLP